MTRQNLLYTEAQLLKPRKFFELGCSLSSHAWEAVTQVPLNDATTIGQKTKHQITTRLLVLLYIAGLQAC